MVQGQGPSAHLWAAPERASQRANPLPPTIDLVARGRALFVRDCSPCHGTSGHGDGPQARSLDPRPADLPSEHVQSQSDGALFWKLSEGRGMMPKATLNDKEKWMVIDYVRSLAPRP